MTKIRWRLSSLVLIVSMALSLSAYAGISDLAFDSSQLLVYNVPLADEDIEPGLTIATNAAEHLTLSDRKNFLGFLHGSPEQMRLTVADTATFRLNKVPWQYKQR